MMRTSKMSRSEPMVCDRTDPPQCYHPMTPERWEDAGRLASARAAAEASRPKMCPNCAGPNITPTFAEIGVDQWECHESMCLAVWRID